MLLNKRKLNKFSRFKKLQKAQFVNEQVKLQKAAEEQKQKQDILSAKKNELNREAEAFNQQLQSGNISPVIMASANAVIAREGEALQNAEQAVCAAGESLNGVLASYLDTRKNLDWLEAQHDFYQTELNAEVEKIETEELVQLHSNRGGK